MRSKRRDSNVEFLRIVCMLLIIMHHCCLYGPWRDTQSTAVGIMMDCLSVGGKIGVNCYILITGYYQCTSRFRFRSLIKILAQVYFYALIIFVGYCFIVQVPSMNITVRSLFPWFTELNWFVPPYLLLYCVSPVINLAIRRLSPRDLSAIVIIGFVTLSAIPTIVQQSAFEANFIWFAFLYLCGTELRMLKTRQVDVRISLGKMVLNHRILLSIICLLTVLSYACMAHIHILKDIEYINISVFYEQSSVPILILALVLFVSLLEWDMHYSVFINIAGRCSFGVYLIHDNPLLRESWPLLDSLDGAISLYCIPLAVVIICCAIYIVFGAIDYLRMMTVEKLLMTKLEANFKPGFDYVDSRVATLFAPSGRRD